MMKRTGKIANSRIDHFWKGMLIPVLIFTCLFIFLAAGTGRISSASKSESRQILEDAVVRAIVQCYAIEGMYPPDIAYLEANYGLAFDHDRFIVHYEVFAANILPDITVIDFSM